MDGKRFALLFFALWLAGFALRAQETEGQDAPEAEDVETADTRHPVLAAPDTLVDRAARRILESQGIVAPQEREGDYLKEGHYDHIPRLREIPEVDSSAFAQMRERYRSGDFDYEEQVFQTNLFERVWRRIGKWLNALMPDGKYLTFGDWFYKLLAAVAIVAALLILYRALFSGNRMLARSEKEGEEDSEIRFVEKNLLDVDLAGYIARAEKDGDFALAIRYLNLLNIQILARRNAIRWKHSKTNVELAEEIADPELKREFEDNVLIFNRIWFGNSPLDGTKYAEYARCFLRFQTKWK